MTLPYFGNTNGEDLVAEPHEALFLAPSPEHDEATPLMGKIAYDGAVGAIWAAEGRDDQELVNKLRRKAGIPAFEDDGK